MSKTELSSRSQNRKPVKSRVVVVSNRLPLTFSKIRDQHHKLTRSSGGLISAIEPLHKAYKLTWVGSLGPAVNVKNHPQKEGGEFRYENVQVTRSEWQGYYNGFSNRALWPLLHYFTGLCNFDDKHWQQYKEVNQKFANKVLKVTSKNDYIWVHDFHLMLVPSMIRKKRPDAKIGFFLHTPFPSSEVFRVFPWRNEVINGLLGSDLIGFHTYDYLRHFRSSLLRSCGIESEMTGIHFEGRYIALDAIPVGADVDRIHEIQKSPKVQKNFESLIKGKSKIKILLGVDRLDYTKGIDARLEAYEAFLDQNPQWRGKVEFYQIMVPSRTEVDNYAQLKNRIDALAGKINAEYGKHNWTPVRCFFRQFSMEDLVNYYALADVAVVTPLRDGMNLVAKEYLLAQRPEKPGAIILSEFCGAASELSEAITVNPWNRQQVTKAYLDALEMEPSEVKRRYDAMLDTLEVYSAKNWGKRFIESLSQVAGHESSLGTNFDRVIQKKVKSAYSKAKKRLILLDYDGTLTDIVNSPERAKPSAEILKLLKSLNSNPKNTVMIVSGRPRQTLEEWLMRSGVLLCGEHGAWVWDGNEWQMTYHNTHPHWKQQIRPVMELYTSRTAGSFIEEKDEALAWHYRLSEPDYGSWQANNLMFNLESLLAGMPLQSLMGKKVVEIRHQSVNKGAAWRWFEKQKAAFDFVLSIGDDRTDEDIFNALPKDAVTLHVGSSDSAAKYRVTSPAEVRTFLKSLAATK